MAQSKVFFAPEMQERPIVFEVFTDSDDESDAIKQMRSIIPDDSFNLRKAVGNLLGEKVKSAIRNIIGK